MPDETHYIHKMIAVTSRHYIRGCDEALAGNMRSQFQNLFTEKLFQVAGFHPKAIVIREKDMDPDAYFQLIRFVTGRFAEEGISTPLYLHSFIPSAPIPGIQGIHMPLSLLKQTMTSEPHALAAFTEIGTSVHSIADVKEAEQLGASYCFAGNIWETTCKPGKKAAGLDFLSSVVLHSHIPVYAIGGVTVNKMPAILKTGAAGGCMMSGFFRD